MTLLSAHQASKHLGVSSRTLRRWHSQGKIKATRTLGGVRVYSIDDILSTPTSVTSSQPPSNPDPVSTYGCIYARVSSPKQRQDLERQKQHLQQLYPSHRVITDVASGINFKRPGLKTLIELSYRGLVTEVVVAHRDRLCRFAYELLEHIFILNGTKVIVVHSEDSVPTLTSVAQELSEDILAINTVFICRMQGRRAAENRRRRKEQQIQRQEQGQGGSHIRKEKDGGESDEDFEDLDLFEDDQAMAELC